MARSRAPRYAKHNTVWSTRLLTMRLCLLTYVVIQLKLYTAPVCLHSAGSLEGHTSSPHELRTKHLLDENKTPDHGQIYDFDNILKVK
jgi:hypothetical protein